MRAKFKFDSATNTDVALCIDGEVVDIVEVLFDYPDGDRMILCKHKTPNMDRDDSMWALWESTLEYINE